MEQIVSYIERSSAVTRALLEAVPQILSIGGAMVAALKRGNKIMVIGNGGSAVQAQHFAAELMVKFKKVRQPYATLALTSDVAVLTAHANDFEYSTLFSRQIEALGKQGDVLLALTTSGNSQNVYMGLNQFFTPFKFVSVVLTGQDGGVVAQSGGAQYVLKVGSNETAVIQDAHQVIIHALSDYIERMLTSEPV